MIVMKFGGTSVADAEAISRMINIVESKLDKNPIIVVSAMAKVTDLLYQIADAAEQKDEATARALVSDLRNRHTTVINGLIPDGPEREKALEEVYRICHNLEVFVEAVCTLGELTPRSKATIISNGERLSSVVICYAMRQRGINVGFSDARKMIIVTGDKLKGEPDMEAIQELVPKKIALRTDAGYPVVITQGFIATTPEGDAAVLGRGGSDYTASLIGMAMNAETIEIWTDVDGVKTADPRRVANTHSIERIAFEEAAEMAHFGAKVLHPLTIAPAVEKNIPVKVLNSMNPTSPGTIILQSDQIEEGAKSISFKEKILMLNIFSPKMIDVSGFLQRVFQIFAKHNVSVDLISTSEANISITMDAGQDLTQVVEELSEFAEVRVFDDKSQVSIIGKNVANQRGLLRWALASLNNVTVYMISQGASSVNISFVVDRENLDEVLQEMHNILFEY
ncbi:MAG: aspartate kinase [Bacteroidales bacterium]|nr:aspartate kinase [Bacteroidales bacterium]